MTFDSPVIGPFTEKWQLWKNDAGAYAVVLRGTVMTAGSIVEDLISFLAPAIGRLTIGHIQIDYKFAGSTDASVHFGFALGTLLLLRDPLGGAPTGRLQGIDGCSVKSEPSVNDAGRGSWRLPTD